MVADGVKKRFIAGAVCPACGAEDKIYVLAQPAGDLRACSACHFSDQRPVSGQDDDGSEWFAIRLPE